MKKILLTLTLATLTLAGFSQKTVVKVHQSNGSVTTFDSEQVTKITFEEASEDPEEVQAIDLGLSVKWASANVGATRPESFGGYYAWGETQEKDVYNETTYKYYNLEWQTITKIGIEISGTQYDAAKKQMGNDWRIPTQAEWKELVENCTWTHGTVNGVTGFTVEGPNGNSIFLPCAGRLYDNGSSDRNGYENVSGFYWTGTLAEDNEYNYRIYRASLSPSLYAADGYDVPEIGMSIRAVQGTRDNEETDPEPEPGPMNMVDLGLSVKWGGHNVGAAKPSEVGNYYSWGCNKVQTLYGDAAYPHYNAETEMYDDLGQDISGTRYDVATVRWGEGWRIPTKAELEELVNECVWTWTTLDGHYGYNVQGPSGNSIFLPLGGMMGAEGLMQGSFGDILGFVGYYTSSTEKPSVYSPSPHSRFCLKLKSDSHKVDDTFKSIGILVRPVHN